MSQPFVGQVQPFGFNFAPRGWALCNGQTVPISQNNALYSLIGTTYGGDGQSTFNLPNLQSRVPMHVGTFNGNSYVQGQMAGEENVTLLPANLPPHTHSFSGTNANATLGNPTTGVALASIVNVDQGTPGFYYAPDATTQPLNPTSVWPTGNNQAHANLQPYLTISWCIALQGIFPSRN